MMRVLVFPMVRKNGFALEEDPHALPGNHFKLKAVPFSKNITFGVEGNKCLLFFFLWANGMLWNQKFTS